MEGAVLIVGCARNIARHVAHVIGEMHRIGTRFGDYAVVIYENDSTDGTRERLLSREGERVRVITETNVPGSRTTRLAHGRNVLLRAARDMAERFDWLLVMDMDFAAQIDLRGVEAAVASWEALRWNACTATTKKYYDFWALRSPDVMNYDCWTDADAIRRHGNCSRYHGRWQPRSVTWVESAFNGMVIHRMDAVARSDCEYVGTDEYGRETCEHVSFYRCLGRVIIHPKLVAQVHTEATTWIAIVVVTTVVIAVVLIAALSTFLRRTAT